MTRKKRIFLVIAGVLGALAALPLGLFIRFGLFPPTFAVESIAKLPGYQAPELLTWAWASPVASSFRGEVNYQSNGSVCGPASLANVFRSLGEPASSEKAVLDGSSLCPFGVCWMGLDLDQLATLARSRTGRKVTVLRDLTLDQFREHLRAINDPARRYVINFHRGLLFGKGTGHHSPLGGYLADQDLVFVLDVNRKFQPWLVPSERLFRAMDSVDSMSGKKRGLLLIE